MNLKIIFQLLLLMLCFKVNAQQEEKIIVESNSHLYHTIKKGELLYLENIFDTSIIHINYDYKKNKFISSKYYGTHKTIQRKDTVDYIVSDKKWIKKYKCDLSKEFADSLISLMNTNIDTLKRDMIKLNVSHIRINFQITLIKNGDTLILQKKYPFKKLQPWSTNNPHIKYVLNPQLDYLICTKLLPRYFIGIDELLHPINKTR